MYMYKPITKHICMYPKTQIRIHTPKHKHMNMRMGTYISIYACLACWHQRAGKHHKDTNNKTQCLIVCLPSLHLKRHKRRQPAPTPPLREYRLEHRLTRFFAGAGLRPTAAADSLARCAADGLGTDRAIPWARDASRDSNRNEHRRERGTRSQHKF